MQIPKSNVTPMVRTAPVDPKFLMMAAAMMKGEGKLNPKLDPKDVQLAQSPLQPSGSGRPLQPAGGPSMSRLAQRPQRSSQSGAGGLPNPGNVAGSSMT